MTMTPQTPNNGDTILNSTVLALESLYHEVDFVARHSIDEGREHLNDLEIEHLLKMTNDTVMKIKQQTKEMYL